MSVEVVTFGCRLNAYETEAMRGLADGAGPLRGEGGDVVGDVAPVPGDQHLGPLVEEQAEPDPAQHHRDHAHRGRVEAGLGNRGHRRRGRQGPRVADQVTTQQPDPQSSQDHKRHGEQPHRENRIVRLGQGVDATGRIAPDAMERTVAAAADYAALCAEHAVEQVRFVATSATRDASNRAVFVEGVRELHGATYSVMPDRIEAGSYACAAAITGGDVTLTNIGADEMGATLDALREAGVEVEIGRGTIRVAAPNRLRPLNITTAPFPGFATDMQAQFMAMLCRADGASVLTETIFENRYMHVPELARMGADIQVRGRTAVVQGVDRLVGAPVMATDLRASMSLIIAGLVAEGETQVARVYHLDRGYERLEEKLSAVGADIERVGDG